MFSCHPGGAHVELNALTDQIPLQLRHGRENGENHLPQGKPSRSVPKPFHALLNRLGEPVLRAWRMSLAEFKKMGGRFRALSCFLSWFANRPAAATSRSFSACCFPCVRAETRNQHPSPPLLCGGRLHAGVRRQHMDSESAASLDSDVHERGHSFLSRPVALQLAQELHLTDHLAAGLLDPTQGRFMGFDRGTPDRVYRRVHFVALAQSVQRRKLKQALVHSAVIMSFLRPVALTARTNSRSSHALIEVRSIVSTLLRTLRRCGMAGLFKPVLRLTVECIIRQLISETYLGNAYNVIDQLLPIH